MRDLPSFALGPSVRALLVGAVGIAVVSVAVGVLDDFAPAIGLTGLYLFAVLPVAMLSGFWAAGMVAIASFLTFDFFFTRPYHRFYIANSDTAVSLVIAVAAAFVVSALARRAHDRANEARARAREAEHATQRLHRLADELRASRARIVGTADETRQRIERDLHDGAQQRLVHTVVTLQLARRELPDDAPAAGLVDEALEHARMATESLRELVRGILPSALSRGLQPAVEGLVSGLPVRVSIQLPEQRLPELVERTAYFVVAEALTNVVKHARASTAAVRGSLVDGVFRVEISDDGAGGAHVDGHSGLLGLEDRVAALGGELRVDSPAGAGTLVTATLPLSSTAG
jgi:signal transduction histidine kinase